MMAVYLAMQFEKGGLNYNLIFAKEFFLQYQEDTDLILVADGYIVNEDGTVSKVK